MLRVLARTGPGMSTFYDLRELPSQLPQQAHVIIKHQAIGALSLTMARSNPSS